MVDAREYHAQTNHTPASIRDPDPRQMDPEIRPRAFKTYLDRPRIDLDGIDPPRQPALAAIEHNVAEPGSGAGSGLDRRTVATLCYLAAGITQEIEQDGRTHRFRAASCTGNLHHIDLYLICGDLAGLPAGVYHFDPTEFALDRLREGDYRAGIVRAMGDWEQADDAEAIAVLTSTWWRNAWKYGERTYRHAFWDGGTVIANFLAAAHASGLRAALGSGFVDRAVANLVGVDPAEEAPIAVVPIGSGDRPPEAPSVDPIDAETAPLSSDRVEYPLIVEAYDQSRLSDAPEASESRSCIRRALSSYQRPSIDGTWHELRPVDAETATARPLLETIRRRGSKRDFADTGPTRRQLDTVLDRAVRGIPGDWNRGSASGPSYLELFVLTTGVDGLPDGRYWFDGDEGALVRFGDTSVRTKRQLALNQAWGGEAHVNVYCMADVDTIVAECGNRGYRLAQLEAGVTLGRLYLSAAAHRRLGGTGLTFFDENVAEYLNPNGDRRFMPLTLFAWGRIGPDA